MKTGVYPKRPISQPDNAMAQFHLAAALAEQGRWSAACDQYKLALSLHPNLVEAYVGWGRALLEMGQPEPAILKFEGALTLDPEEHTALYDKGVACFLLGNMDAARKQWNNVLKLYPDDVGARDALKRLTGAAPTPDGGNR